VHDLIQIITNAICELGLIVSIVVDIIIMLTDTIVLIPHVALW